MLRTILADETHFPDINRSAGDFASVAIFGESGCFEKYCSITVVDGERPIAAIIMHDHDTDAGVIEISGAGSGRWQSRRVLNEIFWTCFDALGCQMVVMRNNESNTRAVSNSRRLGFSGVLIPRLNGRNEGKWIFTLTDDAWKKSRLYNPAVRSVG